MIGIVTIIVTMTVRSRVDDKQEQLWSTYTDSVSRDIVSFTCVDGPGIINIVGTFPRRVNSLSTQTTLSNMEAQTEAAHAKGD